MSNLCIRPLCISAHSALDINAEKRAWLLNFTLIVNIVASLTVIEYPAYGKTCDDCGGKNHFEAKCMQKYN